MVNDHCDIIEKLLKGTLSPYTTLTFQGPGLLTPLQWIGWDMAMHQNKFKFSHGRVQMMALKKLRKNGILKF